MRVLELPEIDHGAEAGGLGPDVPTVRAWNHGDWWETVTPRALLKRRAPGVYTATPVGGADLTALYAQATSNRTLAEWLGDAARRAAWDGLDADLNTVAGYDLPGDLGRESETTNPLVLVDSRDRLVTLDSGEPVEI